MPPRRPAFNPRALDAWAAACALALCACADEPASRAQDAPKARAAAGASAFAAAPDQRWRLPGRLTEISGLATTRDGRLFAHGDEAAIVYELDNGAGRLIKNFALGDPIERGDFEGVAITPRGDFYLITSAGRLYRFREGRDGAHVGFETFDTGLERVCEIEGLAFAAARESLIIACKANYQRRMRNVVALYSWPVDARGPAQPWVSVGADDLARAAGARAFHTSAVELDPRSGRIVLLAARERALAELTPGGAIAAARRLHASHRQAEGVAILPDGALLIADEGGGARALLTRYPRADD